MVALDVPLGDVFADRDGALALGVSVANELTELVLLTDAVPIVLALPSGALGVAVAHGEVEISAFDADTSPLELTLEVPDVLPVVVIVHELTDDADKAADTVIADDGDAHDEADG